MPDVGNFIKQVGKIINTYQHSSTFASLKRTIPQWMGCIAMIDFASRRFIINPRLASDELEPIDYYDRIRVG